MRFYAIFYTYRIIKPEKNVLEIPNYINSRQRWKHTETLKEISGRKRSM